MMNQLHRHKATKKLYRCTTPDVPGKGDGGEWVEGVTYVGCYDGKTRWTSRRRWIMNFERAPAAEAQFEES